MNTVQVAFFYEFTHTFFTRCPVHQSVFHASNLTLKYTLFKVIFWFGKQINLHNFYLLMCMWVFNISIPSAVITLPCLVN